MRLQEIKLIFGHTHKRTNVRTDGRMNGWTDRCGSRNSCLDILFFTYYSFNAHTFSCSSVPNDFISFSDRKVNCRLGPWTEWSPCSKSCGIGESKRTREVRIFHTVSQKMNKVPLVKKPYVNGVTVRKQNLS